MVTSYKPYYPHIHYIDISKEMSGGGLRSTVQMVPIPSTGTIIGFIILASSNLNIISGDRITAKVTQIGYQETFSDTNDGGGFSDPNNIRLFLSRRVSGQPDRLISSSSTEIEIEINTSVYTNMYIFGAFVVMMIGNNVTICGAGKCPPPMQSECNTLYPCPPITEGECETLFPCEPCPECPEPEEPIADDGNKKYSDVELAIVGLTGFGLGALLSLLGGKK